MWVLTILQHEKYPYNQSSHNRKYKECLIVKAHTSFIDFKVGVSLGHGFISLLVVLNSVPKVWSAPAGSALTLILHRSHNARTANRHLHAKGERNGLQRRTKVIFGKTMMWALELLRLAKRHISGRSNVEQWRNQACSYSHYRVTLVWRH